MNQQPEAVSIKLSCLPGAGDGVWQETSSTFLEELGLGAHAFTVLREVVWILSIVNNEN